MPAPRIRTFLVAAGFLLLLGALLCGLQLERPALSPVESLRLSATVESPPVSLDSSTVGSSVAPALLEDGRRVVLSGLPATAAAGDRVDLYLLVGDSLRHRAPAGVVDEGLLSLSEWEPDFASDPFDHAWRMVGWAAAATVLSAAGLVLAGLGLLLYVRPLRLPFDEVEGRNAYLAAGSSSPARTLFSLSPFFLIGTSAVAMFGLMAFVPLEALAPLFSFFVLLALSIPLIFLTARLRYRVGPRLAAWALPSLSDCPVWLLRQPEAAAERARLERLLGERAETFSVLVEDVPHVTVGGLVDSVRAL